MPTGTNPEVTRTPAEKGWLRIDYGLVPGRVAPDGFPGPAGMAWRSRKYKYTCKCAGMPRHIQAAPRQSPSAHVARRSSRKGCSDLSSVDEEAVSPVWHHLRCAASSAPSVRSKCLERPQRRSECQGRIHVHQILERVQRRSEWQGPKRRTPSINT